MSILNTNIEELNRPLEECQLIDKMINIFAKKVVKCYLKESENIVRINADNGMVFCKYLLTVGIDNKYLDSVAGRTMIVNNRLLGMSNNGAYMSVLTLVTFNKFVPDEDNEQYFIDIIKNNIRHTLKLVNKENGKDLLILYTDIRSIGIYSYYVDQNVKHKTTLNIHKA